MHRQEAIFQGTGWLHPYVAAQTGSSQSKQLQPDSYMRIVRSTGFSGTYGRSSLPFLGVRLLDQGVKATKLRVIGDSGCPDYMPGAESSSSCGLRKLG